MGFDPVCAWLRSVCVMYQEEKKHSLNGISVDFTFKGQFNLSVVTGSVGSRE